MLSRHRREFNLELEHQIASRMVHHEGSQRIVAVDRHTLPLKDLGSFGRDDLFGTELNCFAIERLDFDPLGQ